LVAASYEFGRRFAPLQDAFRHRSPDDEFFAAIHLDAFKPDAFGGTERIGYAGSIPAGWMPGAPELRTTPYGHEAPGIVPHAPPSVAQTVPLAPRVDQARHAELIDRIHEFLAAGDIYQANLTIPFVGRTALPPEAIFDAALAKGGASYGATVVLPNGTLVSLSPELLLRRRGRQVQTRPIKGTRPIPLRAGGVADAREALTTSEKDRAEHLMIVDLERNDLGRVCESGSITVEPFMRVVEHPTVLHLESTVKGKLREGVSTQQLFGAIFPGGSVTGAPKKRALEILSELEDAPRGLYCGAVGWIDADGDCELNLPIRTAMIRPDGTIEYQAGGGIVADSQAAEEWRELHDKAAFFRQLVE
jgi:anthranilate/para-aminobenzoate synthase component I